MSNLEPSKDFFLRLNEGRESAFEDIDRHYRQRLCDLVQAEMGKRFSSREDPEDAVQSAMASFSRGVRTKQFQIDHTGRLWGLLATITRRTMLHHIEEHDALKRSPKREDGPVGHWAVSREPSPADAAEAAGLIEQVIDGLESPDPEIFRLKLEGFSRAEIAERLGLTDGSVRCKLDRIRDRLNRLLDND